MGEVSFWWGGFEPILRTIVVGTIAYAFLVLIIKVSGKRTLATMNALDFIITVAIGAAFGRVLTAEGVSLTEALTAFILLAFLQYAFSTLELKFPYFRKLSTSQPKILYYNNNYFEKNLHRERINKELLIVIVRKEGFNDLNDVQLIILESDGSFSVIKKADVPRNSTYEGLLKEED